MRRNFEAGLTTVTDVHEAQARLALANAQHIGTLTESAARATELEKLLGEPPRPLAGLVPDAVPPSPEPGQAQDWIDLALADHPLLRSQQLVVVIAEGEIAKLKGLAVHPGSHGGLWPQRRDGEYDFADGSRLALALGPSRPAVQPPALHQALAHAAQPNKAAVNSNKVGYRIGTRPNIDVLNGEQQQLLAERDLHGAWPIRDCRPCASKRQQRAWTKTTCVLPGFC